jgi:ribosomal protein L22
LPRARGSASPIQKKMSHVTMVLGVNEKLEAEI